MIASVSELWINHLDRIAVVTDVTETIVHFHFLDNPDGKNSRNTKIFYSIFRKYEG